MVDRAFEVHVTHAAITTGENHHAFIVFSQLGEQATRDIVDHLRAGRDAENQILAIGTRALATHTRRAVAGAPVRLPAVGLEVALVTIAKQDHVTALAAVTAIGSALRDELLATEADAPVATGSGLKDDFGFVDEHASK